MNTMNASRFLATFVNNEHRPDSVVPAALEVPEPLRAPLIDALLTFQAGETGEGRIVAEAARHARGDADFVTTMRLYIAEEGRHARELGKLVRALGGTVRTDVRTANAFRQARRLIGFRTKMLVLAAAEIVGIVFYELLAERVPCPPLCAVVQRIAKEEHRHLHYQHAYFDSLGWPGGARVALRSATLAATAAFVWDQRALLRVLGVSRREVFQRAKDLCVAASPPELEAAYVPSKDNAEALNGPRVGRAVALTMMV
jgi:hypothetical protein